MERIVSRKAAGTGNSAQRNVAPAAIAHGLLPIRLRRPWDIGMAALQMNQAIGLSPKMFGLAGSLFFIAYFIFEVPSNLALQKFGARRSLARIMITRGLISSSTAFVQGPTSLYFVRFFFGAAEAGCSPVGAISDLLDTVDLSRSNRGAVHGGHCCCQFRRFADLGLLLQMDGLRACEAADIYGEHAGTGRGAAVAGVDRRKWK